MGRTLGGGKGKFRGTVEHVERLCGPDEGTRSSVLDIGRGLPREE